MPVKSLFARALWPNEWLVFDCPVSINSAGAARGLIQRVDDRFEVTRMSGPRVEYESFDSFDAALSALSTGQPAVYRAPVPLRAAERAEMAEMAVVPAATAQDTSVELGIAG